MDKRKRSSTTLFPIALNEENENLQKAVEDQKKEVNALIGEYRIFGMIRERRELKI
jgi:hypothetical protein